MTFLHAWPLQGRSKETGCVICIDQTKSIYLPSSSKLVYMRHHRFLSPKHRYRQWRSSFDGTIENGEAPKHRDGKFMFEMVKNVNVIFGKPVKGIKRKKSKNPPRDSPFKLPATPSQLRRKGQYASVRTGSESPQDSQQT
jgi:hypothetical protein